MFTALAMVIAGGTFMNGNSYCPENAQTLRLSKDTLCTINGTIVPIIHTAPQYDTGVILLSIGLVIIGVPTIFVFFLCLCKQ
jgi:hypothetical protein